MEREKKYWGEGKKEEDLLVTDKGLPVAVMNILWQRLSHLTGIFFFQLGVNYALVCVYERSVG